MARTYQLSIRLVRLLVRAFFRRVEVSGIEHIPRDRGGILVSWHPNGMIDPGLIITSFPGQVVFGARHGLFKWPGLGSALKAMGTVPIYRAMDGGKADPEARRAANQKSLDALAAEVAAGRWSCLFPEGDSHDAPHLIDLKTGAARFYYRAQELGEAPAATPERPPVIVPVGLHYDSKRAFRSHALVAFHPPMELPEGLVLPPPPDQPDAAELRRQRYRQLTQRIERALHDVVHATESWELHHLMHRARKLVRAERSARAGTDLRKPDMRERTLGFARVWAGYYARKQSDPEMVGVLVERVSNYDADMRALGIEDHELDRDPRLARPGMAAILVGQVLLVYLLLPPLLIVGYLVNLPTMLALWAVSKLAAKKRKDEATIKVLTGALMLPLTWLAAGTAAALAHTQLHAAFPTIPNTPLLAAVVTVAFGVLGGMVALRYLRLARETGRAVRVRFTKARRRVSVARLRVERGELCEAIESLKQGLDLPGDVGPDGRVVDQIVDVRVR